MHVRNFATCLAGKGFHEMRHNQTAEEWLGDLEPGSRVGLVAMRLRHDQKEAAKKYDKALRAKGGIVRFTGTHWCRGFSLLE